MARGRTVSAIELTDVDKKALEICRDVGERLAGLISDSERKEDFIRNYGRVHLSRDAGLGRAGGKLQRDALCTRGRTEKAPFSNRNLRWHPLIVAYDTPIYASFVVFQRSAQITPGVLRSSGQEVFQPPWRKSKREEGEAESVQLFHMQPLVESQILHKPDLVRYGHRWCNVSTADHSIDETVDFMRAVVKAHERKADEEK